MLQSDNNIVCDLIYRKMHLYWYDKRQHPCSTHKRHSILSLSSLHVSAPLWASHLSSLVHRCTCSTSQHSMRLNKWYMTKFNCINSRGWRCIRHHFRSPRSYQRTPTSNLWQTTWMLDIVLYTLRHVATSFWRCWKTRPRRFCTRQRDLADVFDDVFQNISVVRHR
jgi:hypothetical protein